MTAKKKNFEIKCLEKISTGKLVELFCLTTDMNDEYIPTVRGWIMDEIEKRNPEGFEKWLDEDADDSSLRKYILE